MYCVATYGICSNLFGVTCITLSNFCNFSQFVLSTHPVLLYQLLSPYHTSVILSNFCHFLTTCYLFTFYVSYAPYNCTLCTHHKQNSYSRLTVRTLSAPIHFPNSTDVSGHRAILIWGDRGMAGGFSKNNL